MSESTIIVPVPLQRSVFTAGVILAIEATGKPVGDGAIPAGANWVGGVNTPNSVFDPYVVVSEIVASHSSGPFSDSQADWQLPYLVESFGISREACSWMADKARLALTALRAQRFDLDSASYGVQQVRIDSIGAPVRVPSVQPPVWHTQDGITLWIGKGE